MKTVRIHRIVRSTTALGPGNRTAIWFQGCRRNCRGCMSPYSRALDGGTVWETGSLAKEICSIKDIEGITISGGEPFLQPEALYDFLMEIRRETNLGVIIYTGNTLAELKAAGDPKVEKIITSLADIIIDGEYMDKLNDGCSLKGSSNQTVYFITERYISCKSLYEGKSRNIQILINGSESLLIGIPDRNTLEIWKKTIDTIG